jgi:transposase-like protein
MACETLCRDLYDCLTFYRFPQAHWKRLRTSNVIERAFREVRRRTRVVGRFPNELSALTLVFATLEEDRLKWRGLRMDGELRADIKEAQEHVKQKDTFRIEAVDSCLQAA